MAPFSFPSSSRSIYSSLSKSCPDLLIHCQDANRHGPDAASENAAAADTSNQLESRNKGKDRASMSASEASEYRINLIPTGSSAFGAGASEHRHGGSDQCTLHEDCRHQVLGDDEPCSSANVSNDNFIPAPEYSIREPSGWMRLRGRNPRCPLLRGNVETWDTTYYYSRCDADEIVYIRQKSLRSKKVRVVERRGTIPTLRPSTPPPDSPKIRPWRRGLDLVRGRSWGNWREAASLHDKSEMDEKSAMFGEKTKKREPPPLPPRTKENPVWGSGDVKSPAYTTSDRAFDPAQRDAHFSQFELRRHAEERCEGSLVFKRDQPKPEEHAPHGANAVQEHGVVDQANDAQPRGQDREQLDTREFVTCRASPAHQPGFVVRNGVGQSSMKASSHQRRRSKEEWWFEARTRYWRYRRTLRARFVKQEF